VNGVLSARNWSGYTSIYVDIAPFARYGSDVNTIAIQVDAVAGRLAVRGSGNLPPCLVSEAKPETDGVYGNPVRNSDGKWTIPVEVTLNNSDKAPAKVEGESVLTDSTRKVVVSGETQTTVNPIREGIARYTLEVDITQALVRR
jgi:beta-galactosidase